METRGLQDCRSSGRPRAPNLMFPVPAAMQPTSRRELTPVRLCSVRLSWRQRARPSTTLHEIQIGFRRLECSGCSTVRRRMQGRMWRRDSKVYHPSYRLLLIFFKPKELCLVQKSAVEPLWQATCAAGISLYLDGSERSSVAFSASRRSCVPPRRKRRDRIRCAGSRPGSR
jgi:hypothetical protein